MTAPRPLLVAVAVADAVDRFDLRELWIDGFKLVAQPLDAAIDGAIVDIAVLAISGVHQLVAGFDETGPHDQAFEKQELGDGEIDVPSLPHELMPRRVEP